MMRDVEGPSGDQDIIKVVADLIRRVTEIEKLLAPETVSKDRFIYKENEDD